MGVKGVVRRWTLPLLAGAAVLLVACGGEDKKGEDRPQVDVIGGGGSASVSASGDGSGPSGVVIYELETNQDLNIGIGADLRDMRALMAKAASDQPVDWAAVAAIYTDGLNQKRPDGTLRSLQAVATEIDAAFPNGATVFGKSAFVDAIIKDGLNGTGRGEGLSDNARRQLVDKGVQMLMYGKTLLHLDAAKAKVESGADGAAAEVDAAWAAMAGPADESTNRNNGLLATAFTREEDFKLLGAIYGPVQSRLYSARVAAQNKNSAQFQQSYTNSRGYLDGIFYLGALRYAKLLETDQRPSDRSLHMAEGWTYFQAIKPIVAAASPGAARTVDAAYTRNPADEFPASVTTQVYAALNETAVIQALGVPAALQVKETP